MYFPSAFFSLNLQSQGIVAVKVIIALMHISPVNEMTCWHAQSVAASHLAISCCNNTTSFSTVDKSILHGTKH